MHIILLVLRKINLLIKIKHGTKEDAANASGLLLNVLKLGTTVNGNFLEIHCVFLFLRVPT